MEKLKEPVDLSLVKGELTLLKKTYKETFVIYKYAMPLMLIFSTVL